MEPGDRLKAYAIAQLQRATACLGWRGSRAHAGVHQARKSLRRIRACLALGESALGAGAGMIDRELSKVCDSLSVLRDAQARVESLERLIDHHAGSEMQTCLKAARRLAMQARADAMHEEQSTDEWHSAPTIQPHRGVPGAERRAGTMRVPTTARYLRRW